MSNTVSITVNTFKATAYEEVWEGDKGTRKPIGSVEYQDTSTTPTDARSELKSAGISVKRGMPIAIETIKSQKFAMATSGFMTLAVELEKCEPGYVCRTYKQFKATIYEEVWSGEIGKRVPVANVEYLGTSTTPTEARAALKIAGYQVKRGTPITIEALSGQAKIYGVPLGEFIANACVVSEDLEA